MGVTANHSWTTADYCISAIAPSKRDEIDQLADISYSRVCRIDFESPGFCLIDLGPTASSIMLRKLMVELKFEMQRIHESRFDRTLVSLSAARFDQQVTTKPHRDGGPDECFLMLGYEPSPVSSEISLSDYSKCAHDMGLTPRAFLDRHNPMFGPGADLLSPYSTKVSCFFNHHYQILLINNSIADLTESRQTWQGVLHTATVHSPLETARRVVNSIMVASLPSGSPEPLSEGELLRFVETTVVRRSGYDKPHLTDDP